MSFHRVLIGLSAVDAGSNLFLVRYATMSADESLPMLVAKVCSEVFPPVHLCKAQRRVLTVPDLPDPVGTKLNTVVADSGAPTGDWQTLTADVASGWEITEIGDARFGDVKREAATRREDERVNLVSSIPNESFDWSGVEVDTSSVGLAAASTGICVFQGASPTPYSGNTWLAPGRLRRYWVGLDQSVGAVVVSGGTERIMLADPVPGLVEAVNAGKRTGGQSEGGSFVVNEHGHVVVPTGSGIFFVGVLHGHLTFCSGTVALTPEPAQGARPGDGWEGLLAGSRYRLKTGCDDVEYETSTGATVRLSEDIGSQHAQDVARQLGSVKKGGGRLYVNEAGVAIGPVQRELAWIDVYVGRIRPGAWFLPPVIPDG